MNSTCLHCTRAWRSGQGGVTTRMPRVTRHEGITASALHRREQLAMALFSPFGFGTGRGSSRLAAAQGAAAQVLQNPEWPEKFPFRDEMFRCYDESSDDTFYASPRFVTHIDDKAIESIRQHYATEFPSKPEDRANASVLDMCSSWISHYPEGFSAGRVAGLGMNVQELEKNPVLTEYAVQDLNVSPKLPYGDNEFDIITNAVSVDYLRKPVEVFQEMHRVLKPGGKAIMSFSNRCFPTKAISIWTSTGDLDHLWIVGAYFHYSVPGGFTAPVSLDITADASLNGRGDPMYVVQASKVA